MELDLKNKVAVILASSKGLGLACAKEFYREGAHVIICSRSEENLKIAVNRIKKVHSGETENRVVSVKTDLSNSKEIENLVNTILEEFDRIDIVVHNAGGPPSAPLIEISQEDWKNSIDLNLLSFIRTCKLVIPIMKYQQYGRIIAITSVSVKQPLQNLVLSNTTRLGIVGFAKTLATEHAKDNILVNVVCPGLTLTDRMKELINITVQNTGKSVEEVEKGWTDQIPLGRLGKPEELANLVVFLASEKASYITGTTIQVDGGFVKSPF